MHLENDTVGAYIVSRLEELGLRYIFGVAGDFVLRFMDYLVASKKIDLITTCNELNAGYAADGYGKVSGLSAVCVTYNVGGLSVLNAVVGASAEMVPMIVLSGAPARSASRQTLIAHHTTGNLDLQSHIYQSFCADSAILNDPATVANQIDHALQKCIAQKQPVYIEIPVDIVDVKIGSPVHPLSLIAADSYLLGQEMKDMTTQIYQELCAAHSPVLLIGQEIARFGLAQKLSELLDVSHLSFVSTMGAKGVIHENHPRFLGVYAGVLFCTCAQKYLESSDFVLNLGARLSDVDLTGKPQQVFPGATINYNLTIFGENKHPNVRLSLFMDELIKLFIDGRSELLGNSLVPCSSPTVADNCKWWSYIQEKPLGSHCMEADSLKHTDPDSALVVSTFFRIVRHWLKETTVLIADVGEALFSSVELPVLKDCGYVSQPNYLSIGYSVPASLGVALHYRNKKRVLTLVGDGAFQMTCQELSTITRNKLNPIILLINNNGYAIERAIHDGPYNDLQSWNYYELPKIFDEHFYTAKVRTSGQLVSALKEAWSHTIGPSFIEVIIDPSSLSQPLMNLGYSLGMKMN